MIVLVTYMLHSRKLDGIAHVQHVVGERLYIVPTLVVGMVYIWRGIVAGVSQHSRQCKLEGGGGIGSGSISVSVGVGVGVGVGGGGGFYTPFLT